MDFRALVTTKMLPSVVYGSEYHLASLELRVSTLEAMLERLHVSKVEAGSCPESTTSDVILSSSPPKSEIQNPVEACSNQDESDSVRECQQNNSIQPNYETSQQQLAVREEEEEELQDISESQNNSTTDSSFSTTSDSMRPCTGTPSPCEKCSDAQSVIQELRHIQERLESALEKKETQYFKLEHKMTKMETENKQLSQTVVHQETLMQADRKKHHQEVSDARIDLENASKLHSLTVVQLNQTIKEQDTQYKALMCKYTQNLMDHSEIMEHSERMQRIRGQRDYPSYY